MGNMKRNCTTKVKKKKKRQLASENSNNNNKKKILKNCINLRIYKRLPKAVKINYKTRLGKGTNWIAFNSSTGRERWMPCCRDKWGNQSIHKKCNFKDITSAPLNFRASAINYDIHFVLNSPNLCFSSCSCLNTSSSSGNADNNSSSRKSKASCFKQTDDCRTVF